MALISQKMYVCTAVRFCSCSKCEDLSGLSGSCEDPVSAACEGSLMDSISRGVKHREAQMGWAECD